MGYGIKDHEDGHTLRKELRPDNLIAGQGMTSEYRLCLLNHLEQEDTMLHLQLPAEHVSIHVDFDPVDDVP